MKRLRCSDKSIHTCDLLRKFYEKMGVNYYKNPVPTIFKGAIYTTITKIDNNPDWMSQAAHSLRELLLPFSGIIKRVYGKDIKDLGDNNLMDQLYLYYSKLTDIAHHGLEEEQKDFIKPYNEFTPEDFRELVTGFENILLQCLQQFFNLLPRIDEIIAENPYEIQDQEELKDKLDELLDDTFIEEYFYLNIDSNWVTWLFENNYLIDLNNTFTIRDKITKLNCLKRIAHDNPESVREIILSIKMNGDSSKKYIMKLITITDLLDNKSISIIINKMKDEKWFQILGRHIESVEVKNNVLKRFIESCREGINQEK